MSAVDRAGEMEGPGGREGEREGKGRGRERRKRRRESAWRFGEVRVAESEAHCPYRPAAESLLPNGAGVKGK